MSTYHGRSVSDGVAIGRIEVYKKTESIIRRTKIEDPESETERFNLARDEAKRQLDALYDNACIEVGKDVAGVFLSHGMMLFDPSFSDPIIDMIWREKVNAEYAVSTTGNALSTMFAVMDDEYMQARATDIHDISDRVINILLHRESIKADDSEPVIIMAKEILPSETIMFNRSGILAFVTEEGSLDSHASILARSMGIPAVTGIEVIPHIDGHMCIVDGISGKIITDPSQEELDEYQKLLAEDQKKKEGLFELKGKDNVTLDGHRVDLYANITSIEEAKEAKQNDAGGIGLFRTEYLYMSRDSYPTEEEQFECYRSVAELMSPNRVVIRTLDIGADKQAEYMDIPHENNPALGLRGIRISLEREEVFKTQLRAIYRASRYGNIALMFPMIISADEIKKIKEIIKEVTYSLDVEGIDYDNVEVGVMIETPAAVMISDELAGEVDFFSIGTNDLMQYMLAADRQNPALDDIRDYRNPAIWSAIKMTVSNAHKHGVRVGICGEMAADTDFTKELLMMGIDELSVAPTKVLEVRDRIRNTDLKE